MNAAKLAALYLAAQDAPRTGHVLSLIDAYVRTAVASWGILGATTGLRIVPTERDPYGSQAEMAAQVRSTGVLYVFTGGSDGLPWEPWVNVAMRAVHDAHDHLGPNAPPFTFDGEVEAYRRAAHRMGDGYAPILWSEIVLQAAAGVALGNGVPQKLVLDVRVGQ